MPLQYKAGGCPALAKRFRALQPSIQAPSIAGAARREQFIMWHPSDTSGNCFWDEAFSPKFFTYPTCLVRQLSLDTVQTAASGGFMCELEMLLELREFQQLTTQSSCCAKGDISGKQIASCRDMSGHLRVSGFQTRTCVCPQRNFFFLDRKERDRERKTSRNLLMK